MASGRHAFLLHQIEHDSRVETAAAPAHDQSIERRESHRRGDALALLHGAHAGAATEVTTRPSAPVEPTISGSSSDADRGQPACFFYELLVVMALHHP
jgi:hypothetical protein